ncbi:MAG TPA: L,D-transpeptidase, partial [Gemmatimonadaceae bacterium]|nr:L,D-transpeptidase [Gemmatimonadaceae bacterium]
MATPNPQHEAMKRLALLVLAFLPSCASAQHSGTVHDEEAPKRTVSLAAQDTAQPRDSESSAGTASSERRFRNRADSLSWVSARNLADKSNGFRLIVSLQEKRLWAIVGEDTVLSAPVATAKGTTLKYGKREWTFRTPRGVRTVLRKEADPIWIPPDWLYAEVATEYNLKLRKIERGQPIKLSDGRSLTVHDSTVGVVGKDAHFYELPVDEHIVFDSTLFVPPTGTKNRRVEGELGKYRLDLGEGYLLHG